VGFVVAKRRNDESRSPDLVTSAARLTLRGVGGVSQRFSRVPNPALPVGKGPTDGTRSEAEMGPASIEGPQSGLPVGKGPTDGTRSEAEMGPASIKGCPIRLCRLEKDRLTGLEAKRRWGPPVSRVRDRYSTERKTIPVRGFGQKNVVLAGIRVRLSATAWICSTVAGRRRRPAEARPATTSR
jgi:hypothetical protein